jgi:hypothetical protein
MKDTYAITFLLVCMRLKLFFAFQTPISAQSRSALCVASFAKEDTIDSLFSFGDDDDDDDSPRINENTEEKKKGRGAERWANLNPAIKARIVKEGQEKAIRAKKKREPKEAKKRREFRSTVAFLLN